jgi:hypothetical protein
MIGVTPNPGTLLAALYVEIDNHVGTLRPAPTRPAETDGRRVGVPGGARLPNFVPLSLRGIAYGA